jgi:hypothetical protein
MGCSMKKSAKSVYNTSATESGHKLTSAAQGIACPNCNGSGNIKGDTCYYCEGTGIPSQPVVSVNRLPAKATAEKAPKTKGKVGRPKKDATPVVEGKRKPGRPKSPERIAADLAKVKAEGKGKEDKSSPKDKETASSNGKAKKADKASPVKKETKGEEANGDSRPRITMDMKREAILKCLLKADGPVARPALVAAAKSDNNINTTCKALSWEGLVKIEDARYTEGEGARGFRYTLTAKGKKVAQKL